MHFLAATKDSILLPPKMENPFVAVLIDFLTIIKYRKKDINKILSQYAEMIRAVLLDLSGNNKNKQYNLLDSFRLTSYV
jgi:hypothetical protein